MWSTSNLLLIIAFTTQCCYAFSIDDVGTCSNDGLLLRNGSCVCPAYFGGDQCESRICLNAGFSTQNDTRCVCPPGFNHGLHCEPRESKRFLDICLFVFCSAVHTADRGRFQIFSTFTTLCCTQS